MACYSGSLSSQLGQKVGIAWLLKYQNFPFCSLAKFWSQKWSRLGTMHAPRGPDLPSFAGYLYTDMHSAHQHNYIYKLHSNITFSWPVVGCVLHQPTSDVYVAMCILMKDHCTCVCITMLFHCMWCMGRIPYVYPLPLPILILSLLSIKGLLVVASLAQLN